MSGGLLDINDRVILRFQAGWGAAAIRDTLNEMFCEDQVTEESIEHILFGVKDATTLNEPYVYPLPGRGFATLLKHPPIELFGEKYEFGYTRSAFTRVSMITPPFAVTKNLLKAVQWGTPILAFLMRASTAEAPASGMPKRLDSHLFKF